MYIMFLDIKKNKFLKYGKCFKARQHLVFTMNFFGIVIKGDFTKRMLKSYPRRDCIQSLFENVHKQENIFFSFSDICIVCISRQTFLQRLFFFFLTNNVKHSEFSGEITAIPLNP